MPELNRIKIVILDRKSGLSRVQTIDSRFTAQEIINGVAPRKIANRVTVSAIPSKGGKSASTTRFNITPDQMLAEVLGKIGGGE